MSKKGRARGGTVKKNMSSRPLVAGGGIYIPPMPGGWLSMGHTVGFDFRTTWNVEPTAQLSGAIGSHAHWEAVRAPGDGEVLTSEVQMAAYQCRVWTTGDLRRGRGGSLPGVMVGPYRVLHRPDDGDILLAAKVLSMAAVQPAWDSYKEYVWEMGGP